MSVTIEPRGLNFINNLNVSTFGSLVTNACWFAGSTALTVVACILLLRQDYHLANGTLVIVEMQRQLGLTLAGFLLGAWTGKTVAGVVDSQNKRTSHPSYVPVIEAKERGQAAGAAAAVVIAEKAAESKASIERMTNEHEVASPVNITAKDQSRVEVSAPAVAVPEPEPEPEQEWASGAKQAGLL
ncbi:MAG TPA: hypothetical protein VGP44_10790 [Gemmatimonadales bacterium]|nr:hypothetical protein [Gemmatimonadales bacterium]